MSTLLPTYPIFKNKNLPPPKKPWQFPPPIWDVPNSAVDAEADVATAAAAGVVTAVLASRQMRHEKNSVPYFPYPYGCFQK